MKILIFVILLIPFFTLTGYSQDTNIIKFVPKDYSILEIEKGNLNLDSIDDVIIVLNKKGEDSISTKEKPVKRNLLILIGQSDKTFKLSSQNENIVYFYNYDSNFKDAFVGLRIGKGYFVIEHYGGFAKRWARTTTFEYNPSANNWFLFEDDYSIMDATNQEEPNKIIKERNLTNKNFGVIPFSAFNIYKELK